MTKLHLGVNDIPEWNGTPLYDVAKILEEKYGLFSAFYAANSDEVANAYTESVQGSVDKLLNGHPVKNPFSQGNSKVERMFFEFLNSGKIESMGIEGVPTQAALKGVKHRRKVVNTGKRRPSFLDTFILRNNFRSWMDVE